MSATSQLIAALVAGGMDAADAAGLVARAGVEMTGALTKKSSGAIRQQRYRDRNEASRNVTERNEEKAPQSVTNRNESVTRDAASLSKKDKKENKKKEGAEKRAAQLPDGWRPDEKHWIASVARLGGIERGDRELTKFTNYALSKGRTAKNWNAAWANWVERAIDWGGNGNAISNHRADTAAGRATARELDQVAAMGGAALRYLQERKSAGPGRPPPDGSGNAEILDFGERAKNVG